MLQKHYFYVQDRQSGNKSLNRFHVREEDLTLRKKNKDFFYLFIYKEDKRIKHTTNPTGLVTTLNVLHL